MAQIHAIVNLPLSLSRAMSESIYMQVVKSVLKKKKKLPGNPVSMPAIINVVCFIGHAGKLLVLGEKFLGAAATVARMGKQERPSVIPLSFLGADYLHNAARGRLNS